MVLQSKPNADMIHGVDAADEVFFIVFMVLVSLFSSFTLNLFIVKSYLKKLQKSALGTFILICNIG